MWFFFFTFVHKLCDPTSEPWGTPHQLNVGKWAQGSDLIVLQKKPEHTCVQ